jgi:cytochrome c
MQPRQLRWPAAAVIAAAASCFAQTAIGQLSPAAQRGLTFARANCAQCHAIDKISPSPLAIAPAFRDLLSKFPGESLRRRLSEGISASHPTMPTFRLDADQISDFLAYLETLEP